MDFIENLSPKDTPFFNSLGSVKVSAGFVQYLEDTLPSATINSWVEGAAATDVTLTTPSRNTSIVQNFQKHFMVSGRQLAVTHAGLANMLSYQEMKNALVLKREIELALHRGSAVSGTASVAPQFNGLLNLGSANQTSISGITLTETIFNNVLQLTYANPINVREVYANVKLKRTINRFSTSVQRFLPAGDRRQLDLVDVYESEFGTMSIIKSRDQLDPATNSTPGASFVALDPDYFQLGWLRPIQTLVIGRTGDREQRQMVGELTLIARSTRALAAGTDLVPNIA